MECRNDRWGRSAACGALVALFLSTACGSTSSDVKHENVPGTVWIQPSPLLQQQLDDEAERLPWTHGFERLEQIRWFASVGEPAYPTLLDMASDPRDEVAAAALAALGATLDRRLVPHIRSISWATDRYEGDLGLERARALLRLGDWTDIPMLIRGLRDARLYTRALSLDALKEATGETLGFDPRAEPAARERGVERWERWWGERSGEGLVEGR